MRRVGKGLAPGLGVATLLVVLLAFLVLDTNAQVITGLSLVRALLRPFEGLLQIHSDIGSSIKSSSCTKRCGQVCFLNFLCGVFLDSTLACVALVGGRVLALDALPTVPNTQAKVNLGGAPDALDTALNTQAEVNLGGVRSIFKHPQTPQCFSVNSLHF